MDIVSPCLTYQFKASPQRLVRISQSATPTPGDPSNANEGPLGGTNGMTKPDDRKKYSCHFSSVSLRQGRLSSAWKKKGWIWLDALFKNYKNNAPLFCTHTIGRRDGTELIVWFKWPGCRSNRGDLCVGVWAKPRDRQENEDLPDLPHQEKKHEV